MLKKVFLFSFIVSFCLLFSQCNYSVDPFLIFEGTDKFYTDDMIARSITYRDDLRKRPYINGFKKVHATRVIDISLIRTQTKNGDLLVPLVPVRLNDMEYQMLFDTGTRNYTFTESILSDLGMKIPTTGNDFYFFLGSFDNGVQKVNYLISKYKQNYADSYGVLPWVTYAGYCEYLTIDYQNSQIIINAPKPAGESIDIEISETGYITVDAVIDGKKGRVTLDTGQVARNIGSNSFLKYDLLNREYDLTFTSSTLYGKFELKGFNEDIKTIAFGSVEIPGGSIVVLNDEDGSLPSEYLAIFHNQKDDTVMDLGSVSFFDKVKFTVNYNEKKCWIEPYE